MLSKTLVYNNLTEDLADYGFESHEDYRFVVKQLIGANSSKRIKCISLSGNSGRRKTAFAHALGEALGFERTLYHDFSQLKEPEPELILPEPEKNIPRERPISALDRLISDACAFSEAENTLLIIDQLHSADFRHHVRIHKLLTDYIWSFPKNEFTANPNNLFIILISEEALYHALQKNSFKVWISNASYNGSLPSAKTLHCEEDLQPILDALAPIFSHLKITPTQSELLKLIDDIRHNIHTESELSQSIFGWVEGINHDDLHAETVQLLFSDLMPVLDQFLGIDQLEILE